MTYADKYFDSSDPAPDHPKVRAWKAYLAEPSVKRLRVEIRRERDGLVLLPPQVFVDFLGDDDRLVRQDETAWEPALEDWLIERARARAVTADNEKIRFDLLLKAPLRDVVRRFGDGFFNAVLILVVRDGPLAEHPEVEERLSAIHEGRPADGPSLLDCSALIEQAFSGVAQRILSLYDGDKKKAFDILGGAVALYLDERFNVTNRKLLGLG